MNAVLSLNHMADWFYFRDCAGLPRIQATKKMNEFRTSLIEKCDDFQIIWDVADAYKHFMLSRTSAKAKKAEDISIQKTSYFAEDYAAEEYSQVEDELVVDIDGELRSVMSCAQNVYKMWECILER